MQRFILTLLLPVALFAYATGCESRGKGAPSTEHSAPLQPQPVQDCTQIRNQYQSSDPTTTDQMQGATGDEIRTQCEQKGVVIPQG